MKRIIQAFPAVTALILVMLSGISCQPEPVLPQKGQLIITCRYDKNTKGVSGEVSVANDADLDVVSCSLVIEDSSSQTVCTQDNLTAWTSDPVSLPFGKYTVKVKGYNNTGEWIAFGSRSSVTIDAPEVQLEVALLPLEDPGDLSITADWTGIALTAPAVTWALTGPATEQQAGTCTITGTGAATTVPALMAGYYDLTLQFSDGGNRVYYTTLSIRIVSNHTTEVQCVLVQDAGGISVTVHLNMNNPIEVTLSGMEEEINSGDQLSIRADTVPADPYSAFIYNWYIDSVLVPSAHDNNLTFGSTLSPGSHRVDVIVKNLALAGSAGFNLYVKEPRTISRMLIDDYEQLNTAARPWYYTRIDTDRGTMGSGSYSADISNGKASIRVTSGWAGIWTSLMHNASIPAYLQPGSGNDSLNFRKVLGPYIKEAYQVSITGLEIHLLDGSGTLKVELKSENNTTVYQTSVALTGGSQVINVPLPVTGKVKLLNYLVNGAGSADIDEIYFTTNAHYKSVMEYVFLFSYAHLSQCYDPFQQLTRDRAQWPVRDFASVQTMGCFSLATALGADLGYIDAAVADSIIGSLADKILNDLPRHSSNLLPHFITEDQITPNTEWSSVDTVLCLISQLLACQARGMGTRATALEGMITSIDWNSLSANNTLPISMGYSYDGSALLPSRWEFFGSESFTLGVAFAAATGQIPRLNSEQPPTFDGSGFNDEMAALFFPMTGTDVWGNDWAAYRAASAAKQLSYFTGHIYENYGWFGLSASEVPAPPEVEESLVYGAWGTGGIILPKDGSAVTGYPIIAPHYAAMIAREHRTAAETLFTSLCEDLEIFSPLNDVESIGRNLSGVVKFNSVKGSWNLCLQALGAARAISHDDFLPYRSLNANAYLLAGFRKMLPVE